MRFLICPVALIAAATLLASPETLGAESHAIQSTAPENPGVRLVYGSDFARKVVQVMQVDCKTQDKRYLPLEDLLLARLARPLPDGFRLTMVAQKEQESFRVQVIETLHNDDRVVDTRWRFAVTEDGGLDLNGIDPAEILKACAVSGDQHLWKVPAATEAPSVAASP